MPKKIEINNEQLKELHAEGFIATAIAEKMNVSVHVIRGRIKDLDLPKPLIKKRKKKKSSPIIKLDVDEIIRLYIEELLSIEEISRIFKVNHGTISLRLKQAGIKKRTHKENQKIVMNRPSVKEKISQSHININLKQKITNDMANRISKITNK